MHRDSERVWVNPCLGNADTALSFSLTSFILPAINAPPSNHNAPLLSFPLPSLFPSSDGPLGCNEIRRSTRSRGRRHRCLS